MPVAHQYQHQHQPESVWGMAWAMFGNMLQKIDAIVATVAAAAHSIYCYKKGGRERGVKGWSKRILTVSSILVSEI